MNKMVTRQQMEAFAKVLAKVKAGGSYSPEAFKALHAGFRAEDKNQKVWSVGVYTGRWHYLAKEGWVSGEPPGELYLENSLLSTLEALQASLLSPGPTSRSCPKCGVVVPAGKKFCTSCGTPLGQQ